MRPSPRPASKQQADESPHDMEGAAARAIPRGAGHGLALKCAAMLQPALVVFEDGRGRFGPLTDLRADFELRSGGLVTWRRIEAVLGMTLCAARTRPAVAAVTAARLNVAVNVPLRDAARDVLLVNGRWLGAEHAEAVLRLPRGAALVDDGGSVAAAHLTASQADAFLERAELPHDVQRHTAPRHMLIERPWHMLAQLGAVLRLDMEGSPADAWPPLKRIEHATVAGDFPVRAATDVVIEPGARLLAFEGPIILEAGARIGANAVVYGPCWIGPVSQIKAQAVIGPEVAIGPQCKVGGEVKHASLHGHTNKAHSGFLGHALVGEWVNLGADTTVSNLKNTYGPVRVQLDADGEAEDTGLNFHGPVIADHVLTAIGTRLLTGTCVGTGAMLALSSFAPKHVRAMHFHTDAGSQPYDVDAFIATARRRMARRGIEPTPALIDRWRDLAARDDRAPAGS